MTSWIKLTFALVLGVLSFWAVHATTAEAFIIFLVMRMWLDVKS